MVTLSPTHVWAQAQMYAPLTHRTHACRTTAKGGEGRRQRTLHTYEYYTPAAGGQ